jgi:hypothetical protein
MHEESPRQERGSRNQDPVNPIPQKSGCHSAKIDWSSNDPFDGEVYRKQQEKHCSKRERGKNAGKKHGSQQTAAPKPRDRFPEPQRMEGMQATAR